MTPQESGVSVLLKIRYAFEKIIMSTKTLDELTLEICTTAKICFT